MIPQEQLQFYIQEAKKHKFFGKPVSELTFEEQVAMIGWLAEQYIKLKSKHYENQTL